MALTISESMEWVYHERGEGFEDSLVRKIDKICWDRLFKGKKVYEIVYRLNKDFLPDGRQVIIFNPKDPVEMISKMKEMLRRINSSYDIKLILEDTTPEEAFRTPLHAIH